MAAAIAFAFVLCAAPVALSPAAGGQRDHADPVVRTQASAGRALGRAEIVERAAIVAGASPADAEIEVATARLRQARISLIPRVEVSFGYARLSPVQQALGPGALVGAHSPGSLRAGTCGRGPQCVVDSAGNPVFATALRLPAVLDSFSLRMSASLPLSDWVFRAAPEVASARANRDAARWAAAADRRAWVAEAQRAYFEWGRASAHVTLAEDALARALRHEARARERDSAAQPLRDSAMMRRLRLAARRARSFQVVARSSLAVFIGELPASARFDDDALGNAETPEPDLPAVLVEATARRPELRALRLGAHAAHKAVAGARVAYAPRVDLVADVLDANPNPRFFPVMPSWRVAASVGVTVTIGIAAPFAARARIAELRARERRIEAERAAMRRTVELESIAAWAQHREAVAALASAREVRAASEALCVSLDARSREGSAPASDLVGAEGDCLDARLHEVDALFAIASARAQLDHVIGRGVRAR